MIDTSKEYIEMCAKATEVQEKRGMIKDNNLYYYDVCTHGYSVEEYISNPFYMHICSKCGYKGVQHVDLQFVWTPRQDQLQEMLEKEIDKVEIIWRFFDFLLIKTYDHKKELLNFVYFEKNFKLTSLEQWWLIFVMKEKYNKYWDGEGWSSDL